MLHISFARGPKVFLPGLLIAALACSPASSSAPDAWAALDTSARTACRAQVEKQHGPQKTKSSLAVTGKALGVGGDGDAYYGLTLRWKTKTYSENWLCLYDKKAKKVTASMLEDVK